MENNRIKAECPYCGTEQLFTIPKEKGLEVCSERECNRPIDIFADGTVKKSMLNHAEPESVSYERPGCFGWSYPTMKTGV